MTTSGDDSSLGPVQESVRRGWKAVTLGAVAATLLVSTLAGAFVETGLGLMLEALAGLVAGAFGLVVFALLTRSLAWGLRRIPSPVVWVLGGAAGTLAALNLVPYVSFGWPAALYFPAAVVFLAAQAVLCGAAGLFFSRSYQSATRKKKAWVISGLILAVSVDGLGVAWFAWPGTDPYPLDAPPTPNHVAALSVPNPSEPGDLKAQKLFYGSGRDRRRADFGGDAQIITRPVDASLLLKEWKGFPARAREWYWGFGIRETPLNGRVWYPDGEGPFPLVLIVHGNHSMVDYSDPGYEYLGELLASRGFITVSVDHNFINGSWSGDFEGKEMPLRAWLLLEHLRLWREWNQTAGHKFFNKVDMNNIALVGHSRGGEAVSIAAAFNRLPCFPDDARVRFDYGFSIRSLVAIAQIDRRYERRIELEDVNFLALQGSYDSDEPSFHGMRQYARIRFSGRGYRFKTGIWIHRANHGQFNTLWGRFDMGPPGDWLLNVGPLMSGEDQRRIAKLYISGFMEATLHGRSEYLPLFRDHRTVAHWLPEGSYISRFQDSTFRPVADFEEDINVTTATVDGGLIEASNLVVWREKDLPFRDKSTQRNHAVYLGWDYGDQVPQQDRNLARYSVLMPEDFDASSALGAQTLLTFCLAQADEKATASGREEKSEEADNIGSAPQPVDLTLEIFDRKGAVARVPLSHFASVPPPYRVRFLKSRTLNRQEYGSAWEPTLQTYEIPLRDLLAVTPQLDLGKLRAVSFCFDRCRTGVVVLDDVGFRRPI